ncbi:MAG TPA: lipase family protein [Bryobacteraceae bacterium]|nr:lipase family protein [Bryobacteraceae bacterium]
MTFDPQFAINVAYPAANSAYLIQTVPNPPLPGGFALAGAIEADPQQAVALMAKTDPKQHVMVNAMLADSNIFGLVAWNPADKMAIVSFRGTVDVHDWIEDFDAVPVDYVPVAGIGLVHMGFQLVYEHVRKNVGGLLQNQCKGVQKILITGHSLGAAVAILSGFDIAKNAVPGSAPDFCTFAGPRAGDPGFAKKFNAAFPVCNRIVNFMDVVPQVPLPPVYEHVGTEILVHGGFKPLDITFAHRLTTYLAGLQKLAAPPASSSTSA